MAKKNDVNRWKELHNHFERPITRGEQSKATIYRMEICRVTGWGKTSYYRKMENPAELSISDKITIANVYDLPAHFLFPELLSETSLSTTLLNKA